MIPTLQPKTITIDVPVAPAEPAPSYRLFLRGAILWGMSLGFTLGAVLLLARTVGLPGHLGFAWWYGDVQTHGALQLLGWMTLFIMGVGLHVLPRFHGVLAVSRRRSVLLFVLLLGGLLARVGAHITGFLLGPTLVPGALAALSGALVLAAAVFFAVLLINILRRSARPDGPPSAYLTAAALWLVLGAAAHAGQMLYLALGEQLIIPDVFNEPVLHALLVGFGIQFTLAMAQRILPGWPGVSALPRGRAYLIWAGLNAGLALRTAGLLTAAVAPAALPVAAAQVGSLLEALALGAFALSFAPWRSRNFRSTWRSPRADFTTAVVAAFAWLVIAALLEQALTVRAMLGTAPSYFDISALRHAYALGFLTLMVLGMAYRMVPAFGGTPLVGPAAYSAAIWLLLASVTLRVPLTLAAGVLPPEAAALNGLSGVLGATGFALWGVCVWRTLNRSGRPATHCPRKATGIAAPAAPARTAQAAALLPVTGDMTPASVVEQYPATLPVFARYGFGILQDPVFRNTAGRRVTLARAAALHRINLAVLLTDLNRAARQETTPNGQP